MLMAKQRAEPLRVDVGTSAVRAGVKATRNGKVLMNRPNARSAPSPACMRPINTVPNTTS